MALNLTLPTPNGDENVWGGVLNAYLTGLNQGKADQTVVDQLQTSVSSSLAQRVTNTVFTQYQNDQAVAVAALVPKTDYETYKAQVSTSLQGKSAVDHVHNAATDITSGLLDPARLGLGSVNQIAVRNVAGILAPILLSAAANSLSIVQRTLGGQIVAAAPTDSTHVATKSYTDKIASTNKSYGDPGRLRALPVMLNGPTVTVTKNGASSADIVNVRNVVATDAAYLFTGNGPTLTDIFIRSTVGSGTAATVEWETDSALFDMRLVGQNTNASLFVDGQLVDPQTIQTDSSGAYYIARVDWAGVKQPRRYRLTGVNLHFGGLRVAALDSVWRPEEIRPFVWGLGDSYMFGTGATPVAQSSFAVAATNLGWDYLGDGIGGAGWTNSTGGGPASQRINEKLATLTRAPDYVWIDLGYNNATTAVADVRAAVDAAIVRAKIVAPQAKLVLFGPATPTGVLTTQLAGIRDAIKAGADAAGVTFIDISDVITLGNKALYTDTDNQHPNAAGHVFIGQRKAALVAQALKLGSVESTYTKAQVDAQVGTKVGVILVPAGTTTVPSGTPAGTLILERKA